MGLTIFTALLGLTVSILVGYIVKQDNEIKELNKLIVKQDKTISGQYSKLHAISNALEDK